jgi:ParB family transcriptional regulator, chromosome partitioning protein
MGVHKMSSKLSISQRAMLAATPVSTATIAKPSAVTHSAKTGPGAMVAFMSSESAIQRENEDLKEELKQWDGSTPTKKLDPNLIVHSHWANRDEDSFHLPAFELFKAEIASAGGNIQPIKVRPIPNSSPQKYEIVFGHRRHRACLDLGLDVLTFIESLSDVALFEEMDRENRSREDLRPYEQGLMYRRALDEGLYPSLRNLAESIGAFASNVSIAVQIAKLPEKILDAFPSRLDIQYRWGAPLAELVKTEPDAVFAEADSIMAARGKGVYYEAAEVFAMLTKQNNGDTKSSLKDILAEGKVVATIKTTKAGHVISIKKDAFPIEKLGKLEMLISTFLTK